MSPAPHPRMHGLTHVKGGPDPVPGLLPPTGGGTWVQLVADPDLTAWWRLGDTFTFATTVADAAVDSADFDVDSPRNLTYEEAGTTQRPTLQVPDTNIGVDDDGAVQFASNSNTDFTSGAANAELTAVTQILNTDDQCRTWACWIKTAASLTATATLGDAILGRWGMDGSGSFNVGWIVEIFNDTDELRWRLRNNIGGEQILTGPVVTTSTWYFIAGTYDGTTYRLYVNGGLADSATATVTAEEPNTPVFRIGGGLYDFGAGSTSRYFYGGTIDEVILYKRALSGGEIAALAGGGAVEDETGFVATIQDDGSVGWDAPTLLVNY